MDNITIYSDKSLWNTQVPKRFMMPLVRAHWDDLSLEARTQRYGNLATASEMVDTIDEADVCCLSMVWNYYVERRTVGNAKEFAERARGAGKDVIVWASGDFEKIIPFENAVLFQPGLHRSRKRKPKHAFEVPAFVRDSVEIYKNGELPLRTKKQKPRIGFCGQASGRLPGFAVWMKQYLKLRALYLVGQATEYPPPFLPPWLLRGKILRLLAASPQVETDFIIRNRYRAGVRKKEERDDPSHPTNVEFVNNIFNTDYTVCVRGGGNFSKRLYETLACGRIPIFVDTDSRLPYDFLIDWKNYVVWVEQGEVPYIAEKVADFHASLSPGDFQDIQMKCRELWKQRLSNQGFFEHFHEHFDTILAKS